jgi:acetylornithine/succinyldiaminopimelate/putrescine aminotransferase
VTDASLPPTPQGPPSPSGPPTPADGPTHPTPSTELTREQVLDLCERHVCPDRVRTFRALGGGIVMGRREGYRIHDVDGRSWLDLHLNGGVFNLGHRNPELVASLAGALDELDIGNHHFPSVERALLAEQLVALTPGMRYAVFSSGGGEAVDLALKAARRATGRRRIVSVAGSYHGHTGLALAAGDRPSAQAFLATGPDAEFPQVPVHDLAAIEAALAAAPTAAVILETIPATLGFPIPDPDHLAGVRALCDEHGALYIADEVQTGLGRTGPLWAVEAHGVMPDILVSGKGLSGGLYPIAATLLSEEAGAWLEDDGWSNVSTFGGSELGCRVARTVLEITTRPETRTNVAALSDTFARGLADLAARHPGWLVGSRQSGLVIGLRFAHPMGGLLMVQACYQAGLWAMVASFDRAVLQFKPGLLMTDAEAAEALGRLDAAITGLLASGLLDDPTLESRLAGQGSAPGAFGAPTPTDSAAGSPDR